MFTIQTKLIACAACAALLLGLFGWLMISRANLKGDLATVQAGFDVCQSANDDWKNKTDEANAAISKMQREAEARQKAAKIAQNQAASASKPLEAHADTLIASKPSGEVCAASHNLISDFLRSRK